MKCISKADFYKKKIQPPFKKTLTGECALELGYHCNRNLSICVSVSGIRESNQNASSYCNQQNARLVHIDSKEKQQFIEAFMTSSGKRIIKFSYIFILDLFSVFLCTPPPPRLASKKRK